MMRVRVGSTGDGERRHGCGRGGQSLSPWWVNCRYRRLAPLSLALLLTGCSTSAGAATVVSIGDGDTITVMSQGRKVKTRLGCIDAPETSQKPAGPAARKALQALLPVGSQVELKTQGTDRYGRTIAEVIAGGQNINLQMVARGQAMVYRQYLKNCDDRTYLAAEQVARSQRLGVWADPRPMPPWEFRKCRRAGGCR